MTDTVMTKATPLHPSVQLPVNDLPVTITYSGTLPGSLTTSYQGVTYVQTFTNDGTNITGIGQWEPQP